MTLSRVWTVVSTNWLRGQIGNTVLKTAPRNLRILDTSFVLDRSVDTYTEFYQQQGHIPQSIHFNIFNKCVQSTTEIPINLPDTNCFTDYVQSLGVWPDTHVIAYDRFGPLHAYRAWWMFRLFGHKNVSVLDGGLQKWLDDGYEVTTEEPEVERSDFVAKLNRNLLRNCDDVIHNFDSRNEQLVDARPIDHPTCIDEDIGGTIKGARHVDYNHLFSEDGTMKPDSDLKALFDGAGVDLGSPMAVTCIRGLTACAVAAAAQRLGKENVPIYYGSWTEFFVRAPDEFKILPKKSE